VRLGQGIVTYPYPAFVFKKTILKNKILVASRRDAELSDKLLSSRVIKRNLPSTFQSKLDYK
jgi:hypothetical protein